jgi:hypothetical protein
MPYALVLHCSVQNGGISPEDLQGQEGTRPVSTGADSEARPLAGYYAARAKELEGIYDGDFEGAGRGRPPAE